LPRTIERGRLLYSDAMSDVPGAYPSPPELPTQPRDRILLHAGLLVATFITLSMTGSWVWEGTGDWSLPWSELLAIARLSRGVTYATLLVLILGAHEMGHYLACRYYRVPSTLPFFIPGIPLLIGTFGAVIRVRGTIPSRKALFDIAAAGPIAGFVVALPILVLGVARAIELPPNADFHGGGLGPPLLSTLLERAYHGGADLQVGSLYGAAWVGMLFTSMNLFPVGQLDGGHALFAISPRAHRVVSWATIVAVAMWVVGATIIHRSPSAYSLWLVILLVLRTRHPRLGDEGEPLGRARVAVAVLLAAIFVLSFIPTPIIAG
jgi:membrane-associated protease RseP (regulator of RpoE activity)